MAQSIVDRVTKSNSYDVALYFDPPNKEKEIMNWLNNNNHQLFPQEGGSLGERMANAFNNAFSEGYRNAVIIGTDCIEITDDLISKAFHSLSKTEVVLGPTEDGGYYLIGLTKIVNKIFDGIQWSTKRVLTQTLDNLMAIDQNYQLLETLRDIDTIRDIRDQEILKRIKI